MQDIATVRTQVRGSLHHRFCPSFTSILSPLCKGGYRGVTGSLTTSVVLFCGVTKDVLSRLPSNRGVKLEKFKRPR